MSEKVKWLKREKKNESADILLVMNATDEELREQLITSDGNGKGFKSRVLEELLLREDV